ncbi:hypothetical protein L7F22_042638 [Adiantum nelumboides]|nr:hypothetical protein [Adiantum nelumboides]
MIGFAYDGASCMRGVNNGVLLKLKEKVPNIIGVHCVAHREALVVSDACDKFVEFGFLDAFANRVYAWMGRSTIHHKNLDNLMKAFTSRPLEVLRIHTVRWLSRGKVMQRLVDMMPALLSDFKEHDALLYKVATTFQVQFFIHILADILFEMNVLNKKFQNDHVAILEIANALDVVIELFKKRYLGNSFGYGSKNYKEFINKVKDNVLAYTKEDGFIERHVLHFSTLPNSSSGGSIEGCITLAKLYMEELISDIDARFTDLPLFNAAKLFAPSSYEKDIRVRGQTHKCYLDRMCAKFGVGVHKLIDTTHCEFEIDRFSFSLHKSNASYSFHEAWVHCCGEVEWVESYPNLMKLWQALLVIPISTAICERGFSKQNRIKDDERYCFTLNTLDTLMFLSLSVPHDMEDVDWEKIYEIWVAMKF